MIRQNTLLHCKEDWTWTKGRHSNRKNSVENWSIVSSLKTDDAGAVVQIVYTVGSRTFKVCAPRIWNALPEDVVSEPSLSTYRRRLKTFLFQQSYLDRVI